MNVAVDRTFGCWIWLGSTNGKGYGPHWEVWERETGQERPPGVQFDHCCRRRRCVNPRHGELVSPAENQRRRAERNRVATHCPDGHRLMDPLRTPEGGFVCRVCLDNFLEPE